MENKKNWVMIIGIVVVIAVVAYIAYFSFWKITGNAVASGDCAYSSFSAKNNTVGLNNGNLRFYCLNGRFYECGWEGSNSKFAHEAVNGFVIGDKKCNLGAKTWEPVSRGGSVDLTNYYTKAQTYSRAEIDAKLQQKATISVSCTGYGTCDVVCPENYALSNWVCASDANCCYIDTDYYSSLQGKVVVKGNAAYSGISGCGSSYNTNKRVSGSGICVEA